MPTLSLALSGEVLGSVDIQLPYVVKSEEISFFFGKHLNNAEVVIAGQLAGFITGETTVPLEGFLLSSEDEEVSLIIPRAVLNNDWECRNFGTRRHYKEFRKFCKIQPLAVPINVPHVRADCYPPMYAEVPIFSLAPLILQAHVADRREEVSQNN